jgi:hypothetical protein
MNPAESSVPVVAPFDPVHKPKHYNSHPSGFQCIEVAEPFGFCLGNTIKYLWRAEIKGNHLEDLQKARWYLAREIVLSQTPARRPYRDPHPLDISASKISRHFPRVITAVFDHLWVARTSPHPLWNLQEALGCLDLAIEQTEKATRVVSATMQEGAA